MSDVLDQLTQQLTSAPLWIQSPIVIAGSALLCSVIAVPLLRLIDYFGGRISRFKAQREPHNHPATGKEYTS